MTDTQSAQTPTRRLSSDGLILAVVCVAQFMVVLDISIVNVALPAMQHDLHMSERGLQWVINAYTLTFGGFLLLGGRAADLYGRRKLFLAGLLAFSTMSLLGGLAQTSGELITARALQGLGGAILSPATLTILTSTFTEPKARARALGLWSAVAGAGGAAGVLAGGILTDMLDWRWILFINVPIGIVTAAIARIVLSESKAEGPRPKLDWFGALFVTAGLSTVVFAIVDTDQYAWGSGRTLGTIGAGVVFLVVFLYIEFHHSSPLVPMRLFRSRAVSGANLIMLGMGVMMFSLFFFLSQYEQDVHGYSALRTGFAFVPMPIAIIIGTQFSSRVVNRVGARVMLTSGMVISTIGLIWLSRIGLHSSYLTGLAIPGSIVTLGIGLCFVPVTMSATTGVAREDAGLASGLINTTRQIGGSLGLAVLATVATDRSKVLLGHGVGYADTAGYARAFLVCVPITVVAALIAAFVIPKVRPPAAPDALAQVADDGLPVLETAWLTAGLATSRSVAIRSCP